MTTMRQASTAIGFDLSPWHQRWPKINACRTNPIPSKMASIATEKPSKRAKSTEGVNHVNGRALRQSVATMAAAGIHASRAPSRKRTTILWLTREGAIGTGCASSPITSNSWTEHWRRKTYDQLYDNCTKATLDGQRGTREQVCSALRVRPADVRVPMIRVARCGRI